MTDRHSERVFARPGAFKRCESCLRTTTQHCIPSTFHPCVLEDEHLFAQGGAKRGAKRVVGQADVWIGLRDT